MYALYLSFFMAAGVCMPVLMVYAAGTRINNQFSNEWVGLDDNPDMSANEGDECFEYLFDEP
jgi:hypothetical protein